MESVTEKKSRGDKVEAFILKLKAFTYFLFNLKDLVRVVSLRRQHEGTQLRPAEIIRIFQAIGKFRQCNLLVFGLGNDSPMWCEINRTGRTVFLEDYKPWFDKITTMYPEIEAYPVSYSGNITQWRELMDQPEKLELRLPAEVPLHAWDVVLVDGPRGHQYSENIPGRMSSIYMSSQLVGKGGYVFVHDAERNVEKSYSATFLDGADHVKKVRGRAFMLIHRFP